MHFEAEFRSINGKGPLALALDGPTPSRLIATIDTKGLSLTLEELKFLFEVYKHKNDMPVKRSSNIVLEGVNMSNHDCEKVWGVCLEVVVKRINEMRERNSDNINTPSIRDLTCIAENNGLFESNILSTYTELTEQIVNEIKKILLKGPDGDIFDLNLSERDVEALELKARGFTNSCIGFKLGLTEKAVEKLFEEAVKRNISALEMHGYDRTRRRVLGLCAISLTAGCFEKE